MSLKEYFSRFTDEATATKISFAAERDDWIKQRASQPGITWERAEEEWKAMQEQKEEKEQERHSEDPWYRTTEKTEPLASREPSKRKARSSSKKRRTLGGLI